LRKHKTEVISSGTQYNDHITFVDILYKPDSGQRYSGTSNVPYIFYIKLQYFRTRTNPLIYKNYIETRER